MAPIDVVVPMPPTSPRPPETPPSSPTLPPIEQLLTLAHFQQFLELLKTFRATQTLQSPGEVNQSEITKKASGDQQQEVKRASKLEFKSVNEM